MFCIRGKTQNHSADSLETLVENLVKTWECQVGLEKRLDWSFPKQCQFATYICVFVLLLNKWLYLWNLVYQVKKVKCSSQSSLIFRPRTLRTLSSGQRLITATTRFKHCQRHNGPKAFSTLTHSTPSVQSRSINKLWNLGQTSAWFCLAKSKKYIEQLWQIYVTTFTNPWGNFDKSM